MNNEKTRLKDIVPAEHAIFHPGEHLQDILDYLKEEQGLSQRQFAKLTGIHLSQLNEVLQVNKNITPSMALKIQKAIGIPHSTWGQLQWTHEIDKYLMKQALPESSFEHDPPQELASNKDNRKSA
mgnify:CR=1 FL=1